MPNSVRFLVSCSHEIGCDGDVDHNFYFIDVPLECDISINDYIVQ